MMIPKPDPNTLCDEYGTGFELSDDMCLNCDNTEFCCDLHEKMLDWFIWATEQDNIAIENGWKRRYLR